MQIEKLRLEFEIPTEDLEHFRNLEPSGLPGGAFLYHICGTIRFVDIGTNTSSMTLYDFAIIQFLHQFSGEALIGGMTDPGFIYTEMEYGNILAVSYLEGGIGLKDLVGKQEIATSSLELARAFQETVVRLGRDLPIEIPVLAANPKVSDLFYSLSIRYGNIVKLLEAG